MSSTQESIQDYCTKIVDLFEKYKSNPYMSARLKFHINNILPVTLENECKNREKRVERNQYLSNEQQVFIQVFLSKNQYFYLHNNNCFYQYNEKNYNIVKEDDIQHQLLSSISKDRKLMQWKYKTKINIIKQIKERNLFKSIPETDTIQNVLNYLYPSIFESKNEAKYFLTIIGDNILKKGNDNIFFIKPKTRKYLSEIENIAYLTTGITNIGNNFVTKYHESYKYESCRILKLNDNLNIDIWCDIIKKFGLDILCVAAHYSNRYENAETFLQNSVTEDLKNYTLFFKNKGENEIIDDFCNHSIKICNTENQVRISWKNIHYIWKLFISKFSLPNMIYSNHLKMLIKERFLYDDSCDSFCNITSLLMPLVNIFIDFWETNIIIESQYNEDNEFEIDELCTLFKKWNNKNKGNNSNISEHSVLKIIEHYYPNVEIVDNKYVLNVKCKVWDKLADIEYALSHLKCEHNQSHNINDCSLLSFDYAYDYYFNFCNKNKMSSDAKYVVSKRFFEKYLYSNLSNFIVFEKFISSEWFHNNE
uniref:Uncharacterized protein n=1 Tax=viral metagenome TaxID=1070528 RepID=A0A6C0KWA9_9ZZZZ